VSDNEESVAQRINDFITSHRPKWICNKCIMEALGLGQHAHVAQNTIALGTTSDFDRETAQCGLCKNERLVIRATE
jgi:hypothetical protein